MSLLDSLIDAAAGSFGCGYQGADAQRQHLLQNHPRIIQNQPQWQPVEIPKWVWNGEPCTVKSFAEKIYPDDAEAQLLFIMKHAAD